MNIQEELTRKFRDEHKVEPVHGSMIDGYLMNEKGKWISSKTAEQKYDEIVRLDRNIGNDQEFGGEARKIIHS